MTRDQRGERIATLSIELTDLHSSRLAQHLVLSALRAPDYETRLTQISQFYRQRRDAFAALLARHFDGLARWDIPQGGLFFWLELHNRMDTRMLLADAIERGVAFMPGEPFYATGPAQNAAIRLNFSYAEPAQADQGLAVLAELIRSRKAH